MEPAGRSKLFTPLGRSIVNDFRELRRKTDLNVGEFSEMLGINWNMVYFKVLLSTEPNMRRRMLDGNQSLVETWKYALRQNYDFAHGNEGAIFRRILDPTAEDPFDLGNIIPPGAGKQLICLLTTNYTPESRQAQQDDADMGNIPLD